MAYPPQQTPPKERAPLIASLIFVAAALAVDSSESTEYYLKVTLAGTLGGEPLRSGKISVELEGGNAPCVFTFTAA